MRQIIRSSRVVTPEGVRAACVAFEHGRISCIDDFSTAPPGAIDAGDQFLLPGLVDTHVHINEPGRTEWEGFTTATKAADAGGVTCVVDMPLNSIPATTNVAALEQKRAAARGQCSVDYAFWGGVVPGNRDDLVPLAAAGVRGFKCFLVPSGVDEFSMVSEANLREAMPVVAQTGLPLLAHAELPEFLVPSAASPAYDAYLRSRPDESELEAIRLLIRLCREYRCRVHIVHLATAKALPELKCARAEGLPITVETCLHYLYFAAEGIPDRATQFKCAPPIRSTANRELLWSGLREGLVDLVATDHSPCLPEMKGLEQGDFRSAWGGIASLSLGLSIMWTAAKRRSFEMTDVVRWMSEKPAELAGLQSRKGRIAPGYDADLVIFDSDARFKVTPERLHFRHRLSPYVGEVLNGEVKMTFVRGHLVFDNGVFTKPSGEEPGGRV